MRTRRTQDQWLSLIDEFEQSGLTQTEFCAQRGINAKYFSLRRTKLKAHRESAGFVRAVTADAEPTSQITLHYGRVTLKVSASDPQAVAQLVKALAA